MKYICISIWDFGLLGEGCCDVGMLGGNFLEITILEGTSSPVAYKIHPLGRSIFWNHRDFPVEHPIGSAEENLRFKVPPELN